jgi:hypothetical protein
VNDTDPYGTPTTGEFVNCPNDCCVYTNQTNWAVNFFANPITSVEVNDVLVYHVHEAQWNFTGPVGAGYTRGELRYVSMYGSSSYAVCPP